MHDFFLGIDLSLTSTGISLFNSKTKEYKYLSFMKNYKKPTKWTKLMLDYIDIHGVEYRYSDEYSKQEVYKIEDYNKNMDIVVDEIYKIVGDNKVIINIEGYSYGSTNTVSLIDLIALGTLLRNKLHTRLNSDIRIVSPSTLKMESCKLVYGYKEKIGRKNTTIECRNPIGRAGGSFSKREMLMALNDYPCNSELSIFVKQNFTELYKMTIIPSPIPDLIDAFFLLKTLMNDEIFHIKNIIKQL